MMKIQLSWLFLVAGALWGALLVANRQSSVSPLAAVLGYAYALWALFWGIPVFWRWLSRVFPPLEGAFEYRLLRLAVWLPLALVGGLYFSLFGGGLYQFLRHLWRVRGHG